MGKKKRQQADKKNITEQRVVYRSYEQTPLYPSENLSIAKLSEILKQAAAGDMLLWSHLMEDMEEKDPELLGVLELRKKAVSGLNFEIQPASDSETDKMIAAHCAEVIKYIPMFSDVIFDLLDSIGKGFSVSEIIWEYSENQLWIKSIEHVPQYKFTYLNMETGIIEQMPRLISTANSMISEELSFGHFLCHTHKAKSGLPTRNGLHRTLCYFYLFKNFDLKAWLLFLERFGHPLRIGKYGSGASDEDKAVLRRALISLATDSAAIMSKDTEIEFVSLEAAKESSSMFKDFAKELVDEYYNKLILGHSSATSSTPGRLGGEDNANELRQDLLKSDAISIEQLITNQLLAAIVQFQFGAEYSVPLFKLKYEPTEDLKQAADIIKTLSDGGMKSIPLSYLHEKFGIPQPKEGEKTLADLTPLPPAAQPMSAVVTLSQQTDEKHPVELISDKLNVSHDNIIDRIKALIDDCKDLAEVADRLPELAGETGLPEDDLANALVLAFMAGYSGGIDG